jgi:hypothetical protein
MTVRTIGTFQLGEINVAAHAAVATLSPLLAQVELLVAGPLGLGALQADLAAQLQATLATQAMIQLQVTNPLEAIQRAIQAAAQLQAQLTATLAAGIPVANLELQAQVSASASMSAALEARLTALVSLLQASLRVRAPAVTLVGDLGARLSAGPIVVLAVGDPAPDTLAQAGAELQQQMSLGIGAIAPGDQVFGLVLLTRAPSAWSAMQATMRTT